MRSCSANVRAVDADGAELKVISRLLGPPAVVSKPCIINLSSLNFLRSTHIEPWPTEAFAASSSANHCVTETAEQTACVFPCLAKVLDASIYERDVSVLLISTSSLGYDSYIILYL